MKYKRYPDMERRPGSRDHETIKEVRFYEPMKFGHLLLDVGANIGAVTRLAADRGAAVVAVEPEPTNAEQWRKHAKLLDGNQDVKLIEAAVAPSSNGSIPLYLSTSSSHTTSPTHMNRDRLIMVPTVSWSELLALNPSSLKCDIESAEYDLDWSSIPESVRSLAVEFHRMTTKSRRAEAFSIVEQIVAQGFRRISQVPNILKSHTWVWFVVWER